MWNSTLNKVKYLLPQLQLRNWSNSQQPLKDRTQVYAWCLHSIPYRQCLNWYLPLLGLHQLPPWQSLWLVPTLIARSSPKRLLPQATVVVREALMEWPLPRHSVNQRFPWQAAVPCLHLVKRNQSELQSPVYSRCQRKSLNQAAVRSIFMDWHLGATCNNQMTTHIKWWHKIWPSKRQRLKELWSRNNVSLHPIQLTAWSVAFKGRTVTQSF